MMSKTFNVGAKLCRERVRETDHSSWPRFKSLVNGSR